MGEENRFPNLQFFHTEPMHSKIESTTELIYLKESITWNRCLGSNSLKIRAQDMGGSLPPPPTGGGREYKRLIEPDNPI